MDMFNMVGNLTLLLAKKGLPVTITLALAGFACAAVFGSLVGVIRFFKTLILSQVLKIYVDCMRGLPFLMILFFLFYVMPFFGMRMSAMTTAILALTLHTGAYVSEIVRGALVSIPKVQHEASKALAMTTWQRMRYVIVPQAMQLTLPPLAGQAVLHIKDTSVVSIIALIELTRVARVQMQSNMEPLVTFAVLSVFYIVLCYPVLRLAAHLEQRIIEKDK
ncbi:amino acid ABC transporter permease [Desulfospira joergensenii]|uniref:amino acid ABC transporter permease n=1 Tax=Desulfospira joergensenii TaxID=53329 RepID=UPI00041DDBF9|nr:amino acid ABC transporter permease [Desulfospira joergensenii]